MTLTPRAMTLPPAMRQRRYDAAAAALMPTFYYAEMPPYDTPRADDYAAERRQR